MSILSLVIHLYINTKVLSLPKKKKNGIFGKIGAHACHVTNFCPYFSWLGSKKGQSDTI